MPRQTCRSRPNDQVRARLRGRLRRRPGLRRGGAGGHGPAHGPLGGLVQRLVERGDAGLPRATSSAALHDQGVAMRGRHAGPGVMTPNRLSGSAAEITIQRSRRRSVARLRNWSTASGRAYCSPDTPDDEPSAAHSPRSSMRRSVPTRSCQLGRRGLAHQQVAKHHALAPQQLPAPGSRYFSRDGRLDQRRETATSVRSAPLRRERRRRAPSRPRRLRLDERAHGGKRVGRNQSQRRQLAQRFFQVPGQQLRAVPIR